MINRHVSAFLLASFVTLPYVAHADVVPLTQVHREPKLRGATDFMLQLSCGMV